MSKPIRRYKKGEVITVEIKDYAFGGKGIAKIQTEEGDFVVFVQNALPGQTVEARVVKSKRRWAECKLDKVISRGHDEVEIPFQAIPGAPYATLPIEKQTDLKQKSVTELYRRIGEVENIESLFDEYIQSPSVWHYRNKMEYSFSVIRFDLEKEEMQDDFGLGFKHRGTWWAVENLDKDSGLFDQQVEDDLIIVRKHLEQTGLPAWHPPKRHGFFRYFVVRKSFAEDNY